MNTTSTTIDSIIRQRRSIRAFLPQIVAQSTISEILQVAAYAPSGTNTQPWRVGVLTGHAKNSLSNAILDINQRPADLALLEEEYSYYPEKWVSPYIERRRKVGLDLYGLLGLGKEDKAAMAAQQNRNFTFFDAPVGLMFFLDKIMGRGSLMDYGMFIQNIMLAAEARGLATCAQAAFCRYHSIIKKQLGVPDNFYLLCGMSLGYADIGKIENTLRTERSQDFVTFFTD